MSDPLADPRTAELLGADPQEAISLAGVFRRAASESGYTGVGLAAAQHDGTWTGRAADTFRSAIGRLPGRLGRLGTGFEAVARALALYESSLVDIQPVFVNVAAELETAQARLPALETEQERADGALLVAIETPGTTSAKRARAEVEAARAGGAVTGCQNEIHRLRTRAFELLDEFGDAREACRTSIVAAQHGAPVSPSFGSGETVIDLEDAFS
jgi:hypothetical protein